jgi:hypothetical protein
MRKALPGALLMLLVAGVVLTALVPAAPAAPLARCALVTTKEAQRAIGGVYRLQLKQQDVGSIRECTISLLRSTKPKVHKYVAVRDYPYGGGKKAFDAVVAVLRKRQQPKDVRFVTFRPLAGLGAKAYRSEVVVKGLPRRSVLVWTGNDFVWVFNHDASVTFAQLLGLARNALGRVQ